MDLAALPSRLQEMRIHASLSQDEVAKYLQVKRETVSKIERGKRPPTAKELVGYSRLFGITLDELIEERRVPDEAACVAAQLRQMNETDREKIMRLVFMKSKTADGCPNTEDNQKKQFD